MKVTVLQCSPDDMVSQAAASADNLLINQASINHTQSTVTKQTCVGALSIFCGGLVMALDDDMPMAAEELKGAVGHLDMLGICCFGEQGMDHNLNPIHGNLMFGCLLFSNERY
jgi:hypothetical protein